MKWVNFFAQGVDHSQEFCVKKIFTKIFTKIFLEFFKVKNLSVTVTRIFFKPNIIRFQCLAAQMKANIVFYKIDKTEKKNCVGQVPKIWRNVEMSVSRV